MMRLLVALVLCSMFALAACGGEQPSPPSPTPAATSSPTAAARTGGTTAAGSPTGATTASASISTGVTSSGSAAAGCVKACVYLDRAGGPGLAGVSICLSQFSGEGGTIATTDTAGSYTARVPSSQGHQESLEVWPHKAGYAFSPPSIAINSFGGGEVIDRNFVATLSSAAPGGDACGKRPS